MLPDAREFFGNGPLSEAQPVLSERVGLNSTVDIVLQPLATGKLAVFKGGSRLPADTATKSPASSLESVRRCYNLGGMMKKVFLSSLYSTLAHTAR